MTEKRVYNKVSRTRFRVIVRKPNGTDVPYPFEDKVKAMAFIQDEVYGAEAGTEFKLIKVNEIPLKSYTLEVETRYNLKEA